MECPCEDREEWSGLDGEEPRGDDPPARFLTDDTTLTTGDPDEDLEWGQICDACPRCDGVPCRGCGDGDGCWGSNCSCFGGTDPLDDEDDEDDPYNSPEFEEVMAEWCRQCSCCSQCWEHPCGGVQQGAGCDHHRCTCEDGCDDYNENGGRTWGYECDHYEEDSSDV
jgi:hypothetical protein